MRKSYVNYLLSACIEAKNSELAYTTILKYSNPDYVANEIFFTKSGKSTDSKPVLENASMSTNPAGKDVTATATDSGGDKKKQNSEKGNKSNKAIKANSKKDIYTPFLRPESYLIALNACGSCGDPATAKRILQVMTVQGIHIGTDSWNAVLNAVCHFLIPYLK